jgi:hypothetical protein
MYGRNKVERAIERGRGTGIQGGIEERLKTIKGGRKR